MLSWELLTALAALTSFSCLDSYETRQTSGAVSQAQAMSYPLLDPAVELELDRLTFLPSLIS